ncbi:cation diffusion facilitator family transporter [Variovorax sp. OV329]|uniref:cation diffusion facilitator family transporter n=1 Tax=Variovorax sp. OV329 TaxID=1882825 RepID=UPI0008EE85E2|nr:cation transporter [Variovorax sp. OV329]SFL93519.1 cation diffusion facilitator family transporter [Variovorax sp. OV329]
MREFSRLHRRLHPDAQATRLRTAVALALAGGALMAVFKTGAAVTTGSAAMLAEAVHSWIGTASEIFLVAGYLAARRPSDDAHPLGYGRESFVWSLFGSIVMCVVGAQVAVWRGITQWHVIEPPPDYRVGYAVVIVSLAFQSLSFARAVRFVRERAAERDHGIFKHVLDTSDSQLRAVVIGDLIALLGLFIAGLGMALHQLTDEVRYDALGSILIGVLMGVAGLVLINVNRRFLAGVPLPEERRQMAIHAIEQHPDIERVTYFFAEYVGPDRLVVAARVIVVGDPPQTELARLLHEMETRVMEHKSVERAVFALAMPQEYEKRGAGPKKKAAG